MRLSTIDPSENLDWDDLVATHPKASVFHRKGWLQALTATYGYRPLVLTSGKAGERLPDGIVFCEVKSWITGSRIVSLPFSDHCEPLLEDADQLVEVQTWMKEESKRHKWRYIELRPCGCERQAGGPLAASQSFWLHTLDLAPAIEDICHGLHKSCVQRRIQRAEREQLSYERGQSEKILGEFYRLLVMTRRRHSLLPQPLAWFQNLVKFMGSDVEIRVARKNGSAIAAILTLCHRRTVVYKYGCSDAQYHHLGGMPFLMWRMIEESKAAGVEQIDFGRTEFDNEGLAAFKDRLGATRKQMTYLRYQEDSKEKDMVSSYLPVTRHLFSVLPPTVASAAGRAVYRHIG